MSQEHFKKRMQSNEYEKDDFFLPSDKLWSAIEDELEGKPRRRKPFILLFSSAVVILVLASVFMPKQKVLNNVSFNDVEIVNSKDELAEINIDPRDQNENFENQSASPDLNVKVMNTGKTASSFEISNQKQIPKDIHKSSQNATQALSKLKPIDNQTSVEFNQISDASMPQDAFDSKSQISQTASQGFSNFISESDNDNIRQTETEFISIPKIPNLLKDLETSSSKVKQQPNIILVEESTPIQEWIVAANAYSSISRYSIADYTGFDQIEFALDGKQSFGYQLNIERKISDRVSVYAGIGIDHAHFDANYLLSVDQSDFNSTNQPSSATLLKTLPSLAGGLESTFNFTNVSADFKTVKVDLSLAHDFKTVTVPFGARFAFFNSNRMSSSISIGAEYSKRLLSIDTGVNSLSTDNGEVELAAVAALDREDQPFTIHNINASTSVSLDYKISNRIILGLHSGFIKPLSAVYEDQNYTVNTYQIRGGLSLKYIFRAHSK